MGGIRSIGAEPADRDVNEFFVFGRQVVPTNAESIGDTGAKVLDDDVRVGAQLARKSLAENNPGEGASAVTNAKPGVAIADGDLRKTDECFATLQQET